MADKSTFTTEEWNLILESVMMAGIAVTAAEPSGLWGTLKESFANSSTLLKAKGDATVTPLIKAVVDDFATSEGRTAARTGMSATLKGATPADMKARSIDIVRQAATLVDAKAPDDAAAFKNWLYQISQNVAEAAAEGGVLGFGGVQVSEAEKATLGEISSALKLG